MISLSVIVLSKTNSDLIFDTTMNCMKSLQDSESFKNIDLEIVLVESNAHYLDKYSYPEEVTVIIPKEEFGFHKFLNIGIKASKGYYVALCNNDLIFEKKWFSEILNVANSNKKIQSFSPIDPREEILIYKNEYEIGYRVRTYLKGWCIVCERSILKRMGYLDENFVFYYADNDYGLSLLYNNIKHAVVSKSHVQHLHKISTKEGIKNIDPFFNQHVSKTKLPKHLKLPAYKGVLENSRALCDHLIYYKKWGNPDSMYRISRYAQKLNSVHLNIITKFLFQLKRIFKV